MEVLTAMATKTYFKRTDLRTQHLWLRTWLIAGSLSLLVCAHLGIASIGYAQDSPSEYQVKAAYLFNFFKFVDWPGDPLADTHGQWVIGIAGDNHFGDELTQITAGKTVQGHELQVRRFQPGEDLRACHVLFISKSERRRVPSILAALRGASVLTVADMDHFIESGGMIQFVMEEKRVRFGIDVGAASRAHLKVSSKLLSLARTVTGTERAGNN